MILSSNPRPLQLWKTLSLEVADSGLAQVDNTWNMEKVCSPYSRVYFIPEGSGTLTLRGREIALQEGYVYLIPAGLLYNYRCDSHMEQLYFHVNIIQVNGMDLFFGCEEVYERKVSGQYLERVLALYRSQRMGDSFCHQGILWEELGFFTRMAGVQETRTRIYSEMVEQFFLLAQNPVSAKNHIRSMADRLHVSESTLSKKFRAETGMYPGGYLEQLVIQKACRLLLQENRSIAQIAEELEFSDQFYFAKYFKRLMQMPPSIYRRKMRGS